MDSYFQSTTAAVATQMKDEAFNDFVFTTSIPSSSTILDNRQAPPLFMDQSYPLLDSTTVTNPHMEDPSIHCLPETSMLSSTFAHQLDSLSPYSEEHVDTALPHPFSAPPNSTSFSYDNQEIVLEARSDTPRPSTPDGCYRCECGLVLSSVNKSKNQATHEKSASHRDQLGLPRHQAGNLICCFCGQDFARSDAARRHERRCSVNPDNFGKRKRPYVRKDRKDIGKLPRVCGVHGSPPSSVGSDGTNSTPISSGFPSTPMTAPLPTLPLASLSSPLRTIGAPQLHHRSHSDNTQGLHAFCASLGSPFHPSPDHLQARLLDVARVAAPSLHGFTSPRGVPISPRTFLESPYSPYSSSTMSVSPSSPHFIIDGGTADAPGLGYADTFMQRDSHPPMATGPTLEQGISVVVGGDYLPYGGLQGGGELGKHHHHHHHLSTPPGTADQQGSSLFFVPVTDTNTLFPAPSAPRPFHQDFSASMSPVDYPELSGLAPMYDLGLRSDFNDSF